MKDGSTKLGDKFDLYNANIQKESNPGKEPLIKALMEYIEAFRAYYTTGKGKKKEGRTDGAIVSDIQALERVLALLSPIRVRGRSLGVQQFPVAKTKKVTQLIKKFADGFSPESGPKGSHQKMWMYLTALHENLSDGGEDASWKSGKVLKDNHITKSNSLLEQHQVDAVNLLKLRLGLNLTWDGDTKKFAAKNKRADVVEACLQFKNEVMAVAIKEFMEANNDFGLHQGLFELAIHDKCIALGLNDKYGVILSATFIYDGCYFPNPSAPDIREIDPYHNASAPSQELVDPYWNASAPPLEEIDPYYTDSDFTLMSIDINDRRKKGGVKKRQIRTNNNNVPHRAVTSINEELEMIKQEERALAIRRARLERKLAMHQHQTGRNNNEDVFW
eukprot:CAMPEP_0178929422 /NCGR_PEP_ID=MMETSP0786-20121207/20577_1 /TAXON_ID=186022 /ORGANISM="Thalassionema frauenfeldii, Strain CCMP 1798" /LENGTH=388 /DNA_ID=CAMNT_0020605649 /DNA_START=256 /DNA_END=1419 /DNA_ORIENTATION=-